MEEGPCTTLKEGEICKEEDIFGPILEEEGTFEDEDKNSLESDDKEVHDEDEALEGFLKED